MTENLDDFKFRRTREYVIGEDFSAEQVDIWTTELALWLAQTGKVKANARDRATVIMRAAINGTKLTGQIWPRCDRLDLKQRIQMFSGYNILTKTGRVNKVGRPRKHPIKEKSEPIELTYESFDELTHEQLLERRDQYKRVLLQEFPFLDNPVYEIKVNAYCDTVVKLKVISDKFLGASGKTLSSLIDLRDSLKKDLDDFMKLLRIHPSQLKEKVDEKDRGDVGSLIDRWTSYGELGTLYESVDAIQEALQIMKQLETIRLDGSPQLAEWLLWHKTGCRGHDFVCSCGKKYTIHGGFTKDEMYQIVEQAYKVFGYGAKPVQNERPGAAGEAAEVTPNG